MNCSVSDTIYLESNKDKRVANSFPFEMCSRSAMAWRQTTHSWAEGRLRNQSLLFFAELKTLVHIQSLVPLLLAWLQTKDSYGVSMQVLVDTLLKKGHPIEKKPTTKLTEEQYLILLNEFLLDERKFTSSVYSKNLSQFFIHNNNVKNDNYKASMCEIEEGTKGISYKILFLPFIQGCTEIKLIDPYIRYPYQIKNLIDFCALLYESNAVKIDLIIVTTNKINKQPETRKLFEELKNSLVNDNKISFSYEIKNDKEIHNRKIIADKNKQIILDRGLDIFQKQDFEFNTIESSRQESRKCKSFYIIFLS